MGNNKLRYEIVEKWANFDREIENSWGMSFSDPVAAAEECEKLNAKRPVIHFSVFAVKDNGFKS